MVEQLICNQQVAGSIPIVGCLLTERFQSGQMGWTVNPLALPSEVQILPSPHAKAQPSGWAFACGAFDRVDMP